MPISEVYNEDCMEVMKRFDDKFFDLAIVDPPYGINVDKMAYTNEDNRPVVQKNGSILRVKKLKYKYKQWDKKSADGSYLSELLRVSKNQIIFGINYMDFHLIGGRIIWNKLIPNGLSFSDCEIAYCSLQSKVTNVYFKWSGMNQGIYCGSDIKKALVQQGNKELNERRIHPTQKPKALYRWVLDKYAIEGNKILDTHLGSQSSRIAAFNMGFDFWGCEIDKEYFDLGNKRFKEETAQISLF